MIRNTASERRFEWFRWGSKGTWLSVGYGMGMSIRDTSFCGRQRSLPSFEQTVEALVCDDMTARQHLRRIGIRRLLFANWTNENRVISPGRWQSHLHLETRSARLPLCAVENSSREAHPTF